MFRYMCSCFCGGSFGEVFSCFVVEGELNGFSSLDQTKGGTRGGRGLNYGMVYFRSPRQGLR